MRHTADTEAILGHAGFGLQIGKIMGTVLKAAAEVVIERYRIQRHTGSANNNSGNWMESKTYTFTRLAAGQATPQ